MKLKRYQGITKQQGNRRFFSTNLGLQTQLYLRHWSPPVQGPRDQFIQFLSTAFSSFLFDKPSRTTLTCIAPDMSTPICHLVTWHPCGSRQTPSTNVQGAWPPRHGEVIQTHLFPLCKLSPLQRAQNLPSHNSVTCGCMSHYFLALISAVFHLALLRLLSCQHTCPRDWM